MGKKRTGKKEKGVTQQSDKILHLWTCPTLFFNSIENDSVTEAVRNEVGVSKCQSTEK